MQVLQTVEEIRASSKLSEEFKRLLETCPVNPKPCKQYRMLRIICPKCDYVGRLNSYHSNTVYDNGKTLYYVAHENAKGIWGKKRRKYRRCYFNDLFSHPQYLRAITNQLFPYDP